MTQRFRIAKIVPFDVQDGHHGGHLEILQTTFPPKLYVGLSQTLDGKHHSDTEIQNC